MPCIELHGMKVDDVTRSGYAELDDRNRWCVHITEEVELL